MCVYIIIIIIIIIILLLLLYIHIFSISFQSATRYIALVITDKTLFEAFEWRAKKRYLPRRQMLRNSYFYNSGDVKAIHNCFLLAFQWSKIGLSAPRIAICRRYDVRRRKADCAHPWTVLHLRSNLLSQQWKSSYSCERQRRYHDSTASKGSCSWRRCRVRRRVFNLKAGDVISLDTSTWPVSTIIYMAPAHTYFGAYLIWA